MGDREPSFDEAVATLERALTFGIDPSLDGIRALTDALARPQDSYAAVQVTGTNGKTSVTRATAALLLSEGLGVGAYTSPHLESYTERIEVDGFPCTEREFASAMRAAVDAGRAAGHEEDSYTEFELLTAAALWLFRERAVDLACLEVGMGGRWDATSVVDPAVAVVTGVGIDHTERLGSTVEAIAFDKSHIIRPGSSVVLGPGTLPVADVFLDRAEGLDLRPRFVAEVDAHTVVGEEWTVRYKVRGRPERPGGILTLDVRGVHGTYTGLALAAPSYQAPNIAVAVAAAECALGRGLRAEAARSAVAAIRFPGRFEVVAVEPPVILDGAHNPQAASVLAEAIAEAWPDPGSRPTCVLGILADKDAAGIARALSPVVSGFIVTQPDSTRALPAARLAEIVGEVSGQAARIETDPMLAMEHARSEAGPPGVVVSGSLYTVGQIRSRMCP